MTRETSKPGSSARNVMLYIQETPVLNRLSKTYMSQYSKKKAAEKLFDYMYKNGFHVTVDNVYLNPYNVYAAIRGL